VTHFVEHYGLWVVFGVIFLEVAGLPFIPGETALIAAGALASQGHGSLLWTIVLAFVGAVLGTATGYAIGRRWGRGLLSKWPWFERVTKPGIEKSEEFFHRHGSKALFFGRFVPVLRATLGWMAGVAGMPWPRFMLWNVIGVAAWVPAVGLASYYAGEAVVKAVQRDAAIGVAVIVAIALALIGLHFLRRRLERA
jgi:membrane protein DedA with SNARE-associated domain